MFLFSFLNAQKSILSVLLFLRTHKFVFYKVSASLSIDFPFKSASALSPSAGIFMTEQVVRRWPCINLPLNTFYFLRGFLLNSFALLHVPQSSLRSFKISSTKM